VWGQSAEGIVAPYLKQHALDLKLSTDGRLAGAAADWFRVEAARAQFVFVGEEHDVREIPLIAGALWRELVPLDYKHVAIETGPRSGGKLDRYARFGDQRALTDFQTAAWPRPPNNSLPPSSQEDLEFYALVGKLSGPHARDGLPLIWGLDVEAKAAPLLRRLAELSPSALKRGRVEPLLARVEAAESGGNYNTGFFRDEIKELIRSLPAQKRTEASQILDALSWRILDAADRDIRNVKKELFLRQYQAAKQKGEAAPRVMLRFGGYHAARGLMHDFGTSTLANYVAELAATERSRMLNITFVNCRGTAPATFPRPCTWEQEEALKPFRAAATGPWTLFDLRGLREPLRRARLNALQSRPDGEEY
jgi:hypothetical protein